MNKREIKKICDALWEARYETKTLTEEGYCRILKDIFGTEFEERNFPG
jgi:hypothetical protein